MPVSKKHRQHSLLVATPERMRERVERAIAEGRFQQALELAKQLYKQEPSAIHQDLLKRASLGRAAQLQQQGNERDAQTVLGNLLRLPGADATTLEQAALEFARCGAIEEALTALDRVPESSQRNQVLGLAGDWAVRQGARARDRLPEPLRESFDAVLAAFGHLEAGQYEPLREQLQGISLQSPFLEWKILIRGLAAYFQNDDARAVENWQRLDLNRLPARLAAPFRFQIDRSFRDAQPIETQNALRKQLERLQGSGLVPLLRGLQAVFADHQQLSRALRLAENVMPALRQHAPQLVPRLAACFFWAVADEGQPDDVLRYHRVFGQSPDDPDLFRLRALQFEKIGQLQEAHDAWKAYEQAVVQHPSTQSEASLSHLRALVWWRMGMNAATTPDQEQLRDLPPFLRDSPYRPRPLVPSAEQCFQRSLELNPKQLVSHQALFDHYLSRNDPQKAEQAARRLLDYFPGHVPTLEALADVLRRRDDPAGALALLERAVRLNPLDRALRSRMSTVHLYHARNLAEAGHFDQARSEYQAALTYADRGDEASVLAKWAACEFKAGAQERAEELLNQARTRVGGSLTLSLSMLIEAIRLKLPRGLKARYEREFKAGLAAPPTPEDMTGLADVLASYRAAGVKYYGHKAQAKKVAAYIEKGSHLPLSAHQLQKIAVDLTQLEAIKEARRFINRGQAQFPTDPWFYLLEAELYLVKGPLSSPAWKVRPLLNRARSLALAMPAGEEQRKILEAISQREEMTRVGGLPNSPDLMEAFEAFLGSMGGYDGDEDDEPEDW
jgi:tetratricopeptide (TPR) repeat protein